MNDLISPAVSKPTNVSQISCFGPPALIVGEDTEAYNDLLLQVSSAVGPCDFLEEIWVHDVVDLTWEICRWRDVKAHLISIGVATRSNPSWKTFLRQIKRCMSLLPYGWHEIQVRLVASKNFLR